MNINHAEISLLKNLKETFNHHSISVKVKRFITDVDGAILAVIPSALQVRYPVWLFGEFDRQGGYKQAHRFVPPEDGIYYLESFVNGNGSTSFKILNTYSAFNTIQANLQIGDVVSVFTDSLTAPTYFIWIVQQNQSVSVASILSNLKSTQQDDRFNRLYVNSIIYTTTNNNQRQWEELINITRLNNLGFAKNDNISPLIWETPYTFLQNILELKEDETISPIFPFLLDQFIGLNTYIQYNTNEITFNFKIKQ